MASTTLLQPLINSPLLSSVVLVPIASVVLTWLFTTLRYHLLTLRASGGKATPPAFIPYSIPWLGHALAFLSPVPGKFWEELVGKRIARSRGACTLLLGGRKTHIMFSSTAVQALFKSKLTSRHQFNVQVVRAFGQPDQDIDKFYSVEKLQEENREAEEAGRPLPHKDVGLTTEQLNEKYLLKQECVNELMAKFVQVLREQLDGESETWHEVNIYSWLKHHMFIASTASLMGTKLMEVYPDLAEDYWVFDQNFLSLFFGLPRFMAVETWNARDRLLKNLSRWVQIGEKEYKEAGLDGPDPDEPRAWEPIFGSRLTRARQRHFEKVGMSLVSHAVQHLGFMFGLSSNSIPVTGWMLFHCLDPEAEPTLLPRLLSEVRSTRRSDGSYDVNTLIGLPLLQSVFQETMRLYVDVLVSREILEDFNLPVDETGRELSFKKKEIIMAPTWLGHRDNTVWLDPPAEKFHADRFLRRDEKTGKDTFSLNGTNGKLFPFGGGRNMCPGRNFSKHEVLATFAMILAEFDIEFVGFTDTNGDLKPKFPGLKSGFVGNGAMPMDGDVRVRIKKRAVS